MSENIRSMLTEYLLEQERSRRIREQNGDHTKESLRHLIDAAKIQLRMAALTTDAIAEQHKNVGYAIIREAYDHMLRLGMIEPITEQQPEELAAEQTAPAAAERAIEPADEPEGDPYEELNNLVGLQEAKKTIDGLLNQLKVNDLRKNRSIPLLDVPLHMVFAGHAGTGKTTVARIISRILKRMGLLSKGHLVEVSSGDLIAGYVGQTAIKTQEVIDRAKGGVLFIDEAYALSENKFGKEEAIPTLLTGMENNRDDLAVIVAGYTDSMRTFIDSNEGLRSRYTYFVHFDDYSADEMLAIFKSIGEKKEQFLSEAAEAQLMKVLEGKAGDSSFGNARGVRNLFNQANVAQAKRLAGLFDSGVTIEPDALTTFEEEDILEAASNSDYCLR